MVRKLLALSAFAATLTASLANIHANSIPPSYFRGPVDARMGAFQSCYDDAVERNPKLPAGRIVTRYQINTDGRVASAQVIENGTRDSVLGTCVRDVFLSLRYDPAPVQSVTVTYPLQFDAE